MFRDKIEQMKNRYEIKCTPGLTAEEMERVEEIYQVSFPKSYRDFLMQALPVSKGFYNWRDFSAENIEKIKKVMEYPKAYLFSHAQDVTWCDAWGEEPKDAEEYTGAVREKLAKAPVLLPVFAHRYIPVTGEEDPPVLSVHGADVIYYGENLLDYLKVEFGEKKQADIAFGRIVSVEIWSEIL